jgi:hypothetical protein
VVSQQLCHEMAKRVFDVVFGVRAADHVAANRCRSCNCKAYVSRASLFHRPR